VKRRLPVAVLAGLAAAATTFVAGRMLADAFACAPPWSWWPGWAWPCRGSGRTARDLTEIGWDTALPAMLGCAAFLALALAPRR
jgi:hypothetical protein